MLRGDVESSLTGLWDKNEPTSGSHTKLGKKSAVSDHRDTRQAGPLEPNKPNVPKRVRQFDAERRDGLRVMARLVTDRTVVPPTEARAAALGACGLGGNFLTIRVTQRDEEISSSR